MQYECPRCNKKYGTGELSTLPRYCERCTRITIDHADKLRGAWFERAMTPKEGQPEVVGGREWTQVTKDGETTILLRDRSGKRK